MTKVTVTKESTLKIANDSEVIEVVLPKGEYAIFADSDSTSLILNTEYTVEDLDLDLDLDFCGQKMLRP